MLAVFRLHWPGKIKITQKQRTLMKKWVTHRRKEIRGQLLGQVRSQVGPSTPRYSPKRLSFLDGGSNLHCKRGKMNRLLLINIILSQVAMLCTEFSHAPDQCGTRWSFYSPYNLRLRPDFYARPTQK